MKERSYTIRGVAPLVMHNEQLSDPLNKWSKLVAEISKKRKKTEDDLFEMSRREWFGGLYYTEDLGVHVPERCLERLLRDAAAKEKRGRDVLSALIVTEPAKLVFKGPTKPDAMWSSGEFLLRASVGQNGNRIIRSRPIFREWALSFVVNYDETVLQSSDLDRFMDVAGRLVGLLDWRPKHGRFVVEKVA
ncbi:MAG: hypothetical protein WAT39_23850 [Planctomycetota bacterium]